MMSEAFNNQTLIEKLSKLNNSQQSIQSLSNWCVFHRKKAKQIVETWDQVFSGTSKEQKVSFLYLANDILQNSRRKGSEFVNEFWKVLPGCLKNVYENGEENGKKVVNRLVDIWDERKVFGSRGRGLKDEIIGDTPTALLDNGKNSNSIKMVRKDAYSVRIKIAVGGMPEKIVTAYQSVLDEHVNEDTALNKSKSVVHVLEKMQKDVDDACAQGRQQGSPLINDLQEQENVLKQCIEQLQSVRATRLALVALLKEALKEQESMLELIQRQLQVAQVGIELANSMRHRLDSSIPSNGANLSYNMVLENLTSEAPVAEPNQLPLAAIPQLQPLQPVTSFTGTSSNADEDHKKAAAAVAAQLAASSSSAQVLTSILSSLVAEEAASLSGGLRSGGSSSTFPVEKRPRFEKPMPVSDTSDTMYLGKTQQQQAQQSNPFSLPQTSTTGGQPQQQQAQQSNPFSLPQTSTTGGQPLTHNKQTSASFTPPPPPLPPVPPPLQHYVQTSGMTMGVLPYPFLGNSLPPPPPMPSHLSLGLTRPGMPPRPPPPPPAQQQQQPQQPITMGFHQSQSVGFYGQTQASPPV